jgi:antitoxin ParD1/3/4/toxin ParE1/3/4
MSAFIISPAARTDLVEIWDYYAVELENPNVADRTRDEIFAAFRTLAKSPGRGHFRNDLASESLRFWLVRRYLIVYRSEKSPLEIVRILHSSRDVQAILGGNEADDAPIE